MRHNSTRLYYWFIEVRDAEGAIVDIPHFPGGKRALAHRAPLLIHKPSNNWYRDRLPIFISLMAHVAYQETSVIIKRKWHIFDQHGINQLRETVALYLFKWKDETRRTHHYGNVYKLVILTRKKIHFLKKTYKLHQMHFSRETFLEITKYMVKSLAIIDGQIVDLEKKSKRTMYVRFKAPKINTHNIWNMKCFWSEWGNIHKNVASVIVFLMCTIIENKSMLLSFALPSQFPTVVWN